MIEELVTTMFLAIVFGYIVPYNAALNAKRLQNWSEMTFVFSAAIDVQFLDFLASLSFDFCDVF